MLRQMNRTLSRGRVCGTPKSGIVGSLIPSTGDNGAGYIYASLSLPSDNLKEYQGYITSVPVGLTLRAYENSSFIASANDGTYVVPWSLYENGILLGTTSFTLTFGNSVTINGLVGNAVGAGSLANIYVGVTIGTSTGNASATGYTANIACNVVLAALVANATANGVPANIQFNVRINGTVGDALADGLTASIDNSSVNIIINCSIANALASGRTASIINSVPFVLSSKRKVIVRKQLRYVRA